MLCYKAAFGFRYMVVEKRVRTGRLDIADIQAGGKSGGPRVARKGRGEGWEAPLAKQSSALRGNRL